jgi:hypothetical protein
MAQESKALVLDQGVREKVRSALLDAIPEAAWDGLIKAELKAYFEPTEKLEGNRYVNLQSPFTALVHTIAEEVVREAAMKAVKEYQCAAWDADLQSHVNQQLSETLVRIAPQMMAAIMRDYAQRFVQSITPRQGY